MYDFHDAIDIFVNQSFFALKTGILVPKVAYDLPEFKIRYKVHTWSISYVQLECSLHLNKVSQPALFLIQALLNHESQIFLKKRPKNLMTESPRLQRTKKICSTKKRARPFKNHYNKIGRISFFVYKVLYFMLEMNFFVHSGPFCII